ncbi:MAG: serine--tRNA ligase [Buchnera aphidicola (Pentalonia nigronervosa)]|uniref:Serine--tRNA ligase n=1 Tax=Buchnera aphidicola (Pentalonia nigronervosa) TaxID=1309793 RepID=A0A7H1AZU3_9GAMM|nr:MAG: serine--tRNA ligase [Buchnera aphidicola (Pentalonia nigronervosa)]
MLNPDLLRYQLSDIAQKLLKKGYQLDTKVIFSMEKTRKILQIYTENLQRKHNVLSNIFHKNKIVKIENKILKSEIIQLNHILKNAQIQLNALRKSIFEFSMSIPNIPADEVPLGNASIYNKVIKYWGKKRQYNFTIRDHVELGNKLNELDWKSSAKISGSQFTVMKGNIALLHRALGQFMLDLHTMKHGYIETYVPYLVNRETLFGTGQLPKFNDDLFHVSSINKHNLALIPTAEVPLTNLFCKQIIDENCLPIKLIAHTPCFRSESSYGSQSRGLIRLHQFDKVELVQIVQPEKSMDTLEQLTEHAEKVLELLELPYRRVLLCAGEMSFSSAKTYDLEVWFPSKNKYREISSCSNMYDFQARRMKSRYRKNSDKKNIFVHTLNGSGLAISRTLAAVLENYQNSDGRINVPKILQKKYMQGLKFIN